MIKEMIKKAQFSVALGAVAACSIALCGAPTVAKADVTDDLLQIMKAKGDINEAQYKKLKARHEAEKAQYTGAVPVSMKKSRAVDDVPPPEGGSKDGWGGGTYVTALPKGVGMRIGQVEVQTSGDISFFAIQGFRQNRGENIQGGLLTSGVQNDSNSIRAGLLPSSVGLELRTNQMGYDIAAHFGMYIGGSSNNNAASAPQGLGQSDIDFRQVYGTVGTPTMGTFKFGRDIGIFGQDAILNDATLFGAGTAQVNHAPGNTTLGRIGVGYVYADWLPQFSWQSPNYNGFTVTAGIMTPYDTVNFGGFDNPVADANAQSAGITGKESPMVQGRLKYTGNLGGGGCGYKDLDCAGAKITAWTSFLFQDHQAEVNDFGTLNHGGTIRVGQSFTSWGVDGGARLDWNGFSLVGYGYTGSGLGTTALFFNSISVNGDTRDSSGGYVQGSYTWNRVTLGGSWGISQLDKNPVDSNLLQKFTESEIGFVKYKLTDWVNFQVEYVHTDEENHAGNSVANDAIIAGTTFFW